MAEIRWTPQASADFEAAVNYIALDAPSFACLFAIKTMDSIDRLRDFPKLGRVIPERNDPYYREVIQGNYRIFYRLVDDVVEVLALHPCAMLFPDTDLS